ncbi:hypothetical protein [Dysgonomonas sp. 511]|uniref:PG1828 family lipoprotein n=1 Tax=Dysgonomonas sp. 511 TaxID=2302930 RepID=UPI0013D57101|nr:hypothetical protein [Dysgonomonas sp. 511]NDV78813.1 hypothetical protein [Dysgonomonas sp. 511]
MKKLVLFAAVAVAISFAACGNKTQTTEGTDTDSIAAKVDAVIEDAKAEGDSVAAVVDSAAAKVEEIVEEVKK